MAQVVPLLYVAPPPNGSPAKHLVLAPPGCDVQRFTYYDRLEIGRDDGARESTPGLLLIPDSTVSRRHCVLTQTRDGRCVVRDVSRNGTRIDGRRLIPNVEQPIRVGQTLAIAHDYEFVLAGDDAPRLPVSAAAALATIGEPDATIATVLVGDIRDYTYLVRKTPAVELQQSVSRLFEMLTVAVADYRGTVKEFPGDAIMAFWEGDARGAQAAAACRAAIGLDCLVRRAAADPAIWTVPDFPLRMEWGLATGSVLIDSFGGCERSGLSVVGEPVVFAYRIEKLADDVTGPILACPTTKRMAEREFRFRDLGDVDAKGFDRPQRVYALLAPGDDPL